MRPDVHINMQTLTIPASISKKKQACTSCRQRKKKCDAERPRCTLCKKSNISCEYSVPASNGNSDSIATSAVVSKASEPFQPATWFPGQDAMSISPFMQYSGMYFDTTSTSMSQNILDGSALTPVSVCDASVLDESIDQQDPLKEFRLPSDHILNELANLFFDHVYHMFPCFHRRKFLMQINDGSLQKDSPLVLYAMCSLTARFHSDEHIRKREKEWYEQARFHYDITQRDPSPALRTFQAVSLLIIQAWTSGDFSSSWLFIGKAWRQIVALGLNKMDSTSSVTRSGDGKNSIAAAEIQYGSNKAKIMSPVEREELRRALWLLFILDRNHAWPTGWPTAISETHFKVDLPMAEESFQGMQVDSVNHEHSNVPFTRNLKFLITPTNSNTEPLNIFRYIVVANVLLGRVSELVHSLHDGPDSPEYTEESETLDGHLVRLNLSIPRQATSLFEVSAADRGHVIWLQITLNCISMLLHYRGSKEATSPNQSQKFAIAAARQIAQIGRDASRISIDLLMSAHLGGTIYIAACILLIEWRTNGDPVLKEELDLLSLVFDRMEDVFVFLGLKFKIALEHDMKKSEVDLRDLRTRGFKGLLADCSKWSHVHEEVKRRGLSMEIS